MSEYKINFVDELPESIEKIMRDDLVQYESSHGIDVNYKRFALTFSDESGDVIGVLNQGDRAQLCIASTTLTKYSSPHPAL